MVVDAPRAFGQLEWLALAAVCGAFIWSYWSVIGELVQAWIHEPDYAHGFLVLPVAGWLLWVRRDSRPVLARRITWGGLELLACAAAVRLAGSLWYVDAAQAWSVPLWIAAAVVLFGGWKLLRWALPAVVFLGFTIPLPYRVDHFLTGPLQGVATRLSCWLLQLLGQPAIAEGHVVVLGEVELQVAEACSGLRIFSSIAALAFVFVVVMPRPWWVKAALVASTLPIALLVNALRISGIGLLQAYAGSDAARHFAHNIAGWLMIVVAAGMMAAVIWVAGRIFVEVRTVSQFELLSNEPRAAGRGKSIAAADSGSG